MDQGRLRRRRFQPAQLRRTDGGGGDVGCDRDCAQSQACTDVPRWLFTVPRQRGFGKGGRGGGFGCNFGGGGICGGCEGCDGGSPHS